jgi:hypothetical protein
MDSSAREYVANKANLLGAIRLPKGSFGNAHTEVVTDILFFQKRDSNIGYSNRAEWVDLDEVNKFLNLLEYKETQDSLPMLQIRTYGIEFSWLMTYNSADSLYKFFEKKNS